VWGATQFFKLLKRGGLCELLRSRLDGRLWLINPSRADREVHEIELSDDEDRVLPKVLHPGRNGGIATGQNENGKESSSPATSAPYPPPAGFPSTISFPTYGPDGTREGPDLDIPTPSFNLHPARTQLLSSFSLLTQQAKQFTTSVLSHPLAKPIVPHLPEPVRSLITVPGEWESTGERQKRIRETKGKGGGRSAVAGEYESARVYLARWARIVAEEGERARKAEVAWSATLAGEQGDAGKAAATTDPAGVFEIIRATRSGAQLPTTTRRPEQPITEEDFLEWHEKGLNEYHLRREGFRRGCSGDGKVRQWVWEVYLGVVGWEVGLGKDRQTATVLREQARADLGKQYQHLKDQWRGAASSSSPPSAETLSKAKEEWHRIDSFHRLPCDDRAAITALLGTPTQVDCRRTDRNQPLFAVPEEFAGDEEKEGGGAGTSNGGLGESEPGSQTALNPHVATLRTILMTYHMYSPNLGYVQGMSDLLSPIYVVFQADEAASFWAFTGLMKMMENNFLRDQSGMRAKLSTLQHLIRVMDPELYTHLENTDSLNLFFCFRWLLIDFKREFPFAEVPRLWDVLFSHYYSSSFDLFVALAVLTEHRSVILRYLVSFDEVLKYAQDLSIDLDSVVAQAEVLFLSFRTMVEELDRNEAIRLGTKTNEDGGLRQRKTAPQKTAAAEDMEAAQVPADLRALLDPWQA